MTAPRHFLATAGRPWRWGEVPSDPRENAALRADLIWRGAHEPGAAKAVLDLCARDPLFYASVFCFTYDPRLRVPVVPFVAYPFQNDAILAIVETVRSSADSQLDLAVAKSRDMGASWINLIAVDWYARFNPYSSFLLVSRNEDYVDAAGDPKSLFWKLDFLRSHQPSWLAPPVKRTAMHIGLPNGSVIDGESTTGDVGRGDRRTAILMDEFAAFETAAGYAAHASTSATTNCRIFNSTPKGSANAFFDVVHKSSARVIRMHWSLHPVKSRGLYTSEKDANGRMVLKLLSDWTGMVDVAERGTGKVRKVPFPSGYPFVLDGRKRSPWYDRECARAVSQAEIGQELDIDFVGSDYQFFDSASLDRYAESWCRDPEACGVLSYDRGTLEPIGFREEPEGPLRVWLPDLAGDWPARAEGRRFVVGADVAAGTGASNSALAAYEAGTGEKVLEFASANILPADFARLAVAVCRWLNGALLVPDRSGPTGEVFVKTAVENGYVNIYRRRNERKVSREKVAEYGVWLNPSARTQVLEQYRDAIGSAKVINRSRRAVDECRQFIRRMDGSIEHSASAYAKDPTEARAAHGDVVIADALAWTGLAEAEASSGPAASAPDVPPDSVGGRMAAARRMAERIEATELDEGGW